MKKLLFIDCCIRREASRTKRLAKTFLDEIQKRNEYEIECLTLMDENLSYFNEGFFEQRERLLGAHALKHPRFRYAHQFQEADRIVIAAPFWDLAFPALLKVYIENICVEGITFGCNETGCFGTCRAEKLMFITTRGGVYDGSDMEMGAKYLEKLSVFWGIPNFACIAAEALDLGIEPPETILSRAEEQARLLGKTF